MFEHGKKIGTSSFRSPKYFDKFFKDRNSYKNTENTKQQIVDTAF